MKILKLFNHQHQFPSHHHTFVGSYLISRRIAKLTRTDIMRTLSLSLPLSFYRAAQDVRESLFNKKNSRNNPDRQPKVVEKGTAAAAVGSGEIAVRNLLTKAELVFILLYYIYLQTRRYIQQCFIPWCKQKTARSGQAMARNRKKTMKCVSFFYQLEFTP